MTFTNAGAGCKTRYFNGALRPPESIIVIGTPGGDEPRPSVKNLKIFPPSLLDLYVFIATTRIGSQNLLPFYDPWAQSVT